MTDDEDDKQAQWVSTSRKDNPDCEFVRFDNGWRWAMSMTDDTDTEDLGPELECMRHNASRLMQDRFSYTGTVIRTLFAKADAMAAELRALRRQKPARREK